MRAKHCPQCNSTKLYAYQVALIESHQEPSGTWELGDFLTMEFENNEVQCSQCNWKGYVKDLRPQEYHINVNRQKMVIPQFDKNKIVGWMLKDQSGKLLPERVGGYLGYFFYFDKKLAKSVGKHLDGYTLVPVEITEIKIGG